MFWWSKKSLLPLVFLSISQAAISQERVLISSNQEAAPVFKSKADSTAYYKNQSAMLQYSPLAAKRTRMDSLWSIQQNILRNGILGWRYVYRPDKSFLQFSDLKIQSDPAAVKKLSISDFDGRKLPRELFNCTNIEELELINTRIDKIPKQLNRLTRLRSIEIYNNHPQKRLRLSRNTRITFLRIRSDQPGRTPISYKKFKALDSLDLSRNFLTIFPVIDKNKYLRQLVLSENNLTLERLKLKPNESLQALFLRKNKIQVLPSEIGKLEGLRKLSLNLNEITTLEDGIAGLQKLEELSLYQNKLTAIPKICYQLPRLKVIDLYYNQIQRIDEEISNLKALEILYLANNRIHTLPDNIGDLRNLGELYLHHNHISHLPASLSQISTLRVLRINDNSFADFPDPILSLRNLENLDISRNRLQSLPSDIVYFKKLELLVMTENPWEDSDSITAFAKEMRSKGTLVHLNSLANEVEVTTSVD